MKTLILGLGNPVLGDDGVGWRVADEVKQQLLDPSVEVDSFGLGGLSLMERLIGYDRAVLIDAVVSKGAQPGEVQSFPLQDLADPSAGHTSSSHDTSFQTALELGRRMGAHLPDHIRVVAVQAQNVYDFSEELSPLVEAAVPEAVRRVMEAISNPADPSSDRLAGQRQAA